MAFQFLDSQKQNAIDFGSELGSFAANANQRAFNKVQAAQNYVSENANVVAQKANFTADETLQAGIGMAQEKAAQKGQGEFDVEASLAGLPAIGDVLSKGYGLANQAMTFAGKAVDLVTKIPGAVTDLTSAVGNAIPNVIEAAPNLVTNALSKGMGAIKQQLMPSSSPADQGVGRALNIGEQDLAEPSQQFTTLMTPGSSMTKYTEAEPGEESSTLYPTSTQDVVSETPSYAAPTTEPIPTTFAKAPDEGLAGGENLAAPTADLSIDAGADALTTGLGTGLGIASDAALDAGLEAGLAIPGVGEVIGAAAAVYGLYSGIKDLFGFGSSSVQPPLPVEETQVAPTPTFMANPYSGTTDINQSFQSGI